MVLVLIGIQIAVISLGYLIGPAYQKLLKLPINSETCKIDGQIFLTQYDDNLPFFLVKLVLKILIQVGVKIGYLLQQFEWYSMLFLISQQKGRSIEEINYDFHNVTMSGDQLNQQQISYRLKEKTLRNTIL